MERSREWVGDGPMSSANASEYWMIVSSSFEGCRGLGEVNGVHL